MYKELKFLWLAKFPELVKIDTIDKDIFLLWEFSEVEIHISRLGVKYLISEV